MVCYKNSGLFQALGKLGQYFGRHAALSSILNFFNKEWNIASKWKRSLIFRILILPLRLFKYIAQKFSDRTKDILEGSRALVSTKYFLEGLYDMSTRVYGLLIVTFAFVHGLLSFAFDFGEPLLDIKGIIRLALLMVGIILILINRSLKILVLGSALGRILYDFFTLKESAISFEAPEVKKEGRLGYKSLEIIAAAAGISGIPR